MKLQNTIFHPHYWEKGKLADCFAGAAYCCVRLRNIVNTYGSKTFKVIRSLKS